MSKAIFDMSKNLEPWSDFPRLVDQPLHGYEPPAVDDEPGPCPRCGYPDGKHEPPREFFWVKA